MCEFGFIIARTGEADEKNGVTLQVHTLRFKNIFIFYKQSSARYAVFVTAFLGVYWPVTETIIAWLKRTYYWNGTYYLELITRTSSR